MFIKELKKRGFIVKYRSLIEGRSGIKHFFDIIIENPQTHKSLAISLTNRIDYEHVLSILATRVDTNIPHLIIAKDVNSSILNIFKDVNIRVVIDPSIDVVTALYSEKVEAIESLISTINSFLE